MGREHGLPFFPLDLDGERKSIVVCVIRHEVGRLDFHPVLSAIFLPMIRIGVEIHLGNIVVHSMDVVQFTEKLIRFI